MTEITGILEHSPCTTFSTLTIGQIRIRVTHSWVSEIASKSISPFLGKTRIKHVNTCGEGKKKN